MNLKTIVLIMVGLSIFLGIYLFSMVSALCLLIGVGIGIFMFKPVNEIFQSFQKGIYLSEKESMLHRKKELEAELEKIDNETR